MPTPSEIRSKARLLYDKAQSKVKAAHFGVQPHKWFWSKTQSEKCLNEAETKFFETLELLKTLKNDFTEDDYRLQSWCYGGLGAVYSRYSPKDKNVISKNAYKKAYDVYDQHIPESHFTNEDKRKFADFNVQMMCRPASYFEVKAAELLLSIKERTIEDNERLGRICQNIWPFCLKDIVKAIKFSYLAIKAFQDAGNQLAYRNELLFMNRDILPLFISSQIKTRDNKAVEEYLKKLDIIKNNSIDDKLLHDLITSQMREIKDIDELESCLKKAGIFKNISAPSSHLHSVLKQAPNPVADMAVTDEPKITRRQSF